MKGMLLLVAVATIGLSAIPGCSKNEEKAAGSLKTLTMGVDFSDTFSSPVLIAENQGYFRDEGIEVKIVDYPSGRTAMADMAAGRDLDVVTCAQTPVMYNSFASDNYAVIAGMAQSYEAGALLLARKDKGIETARDLKGKRIGTPVGSTGHFFLNLFLIYNNLSMRDVTVIDFDAPSLPGALTAGRVDAVALWQPQVYKVQNMLRGKVTTLPGKSIYRVDFYLVAHKDAVKGKPEALKGLLKAIDKAEDFIMKNREKSIVIVANRMKTDKETIAAIWDQYQFKMFLDQAVLTDLEAEGRWAIQNRYAKATILPDYRNFIYPTILETIKPEAVNIIR